MSRSTAVVLAELPAEVFDVIVAASLRNLPDGIFGIFEKILSTAKTPLNDIIHA